MVLIHFWSICESSLRRKTYLVQLLAISFFHNSPLKTPPLYTLLHCFRIKQTKTLYLRNYGQKLQQTCNFRYHQLLQKYEEQILYSFYFGAISYWSYFISFFATNRSTVTNRVTLCRYHQLLQKYQVGQLYILLWNIWIMISILLFSSP